MKLHHYSMALGPAQAAGHVRPWEWLLLVLPLTLLFGMLAYLYAIGENSRGPAVLAPVRRYISGLHRMTGLPAWTAAGVMFGEWSLLVAALGFYWDVAWHIDFGRDKALFTPPHTMILIGLQRASRTSGAAAARDHHLVRFPRRSGR